MPTIDSLSIHTPVVFADGAGVYEKLAQQYVSHKKGLFILAPSGAGKTHFINAQADSNWIDGDDLWLTTQAQPAGEWWLESGEYMDFVDARSDVITMQAKMLGFWIIGASNFWLRVPVSNLTRALSACP